MYSHGTLDEGAVYVVVMSFLRGIIVLISSYSRSKLPWYWQAALPLAPAPPGIMQRSRRKLFYYKQGLSPAAQTNNSLIINILFILNLQWGDIIILPTTNLHSIFNKGTLNPWNKAE
jgi:hypothetical protein